MRVMVLGDARQAHMVRWCSALLRAGATVRAFSMEEPLAGFDCAVEALPRSGPGFLRPRAALPALRRLAQDFEPDVVTALFVPDYGLLGALYARGARAPRPRLAVAALGSDLLRNAWRTPFHLARARWVLARADAVVVDADMLGAAARRLGVAAAKIRRLHWLPDLSRFAFRAERADGAPVVVSTRQLAPLYDVRTLVAAMREVEAKRPSVRLVVAGEGPERAALERASLGLGARFTGRLDAHSLAALLGEATVYVSTSRSDSTSVSLLEAMAAGAFPVVTDIEGNREWVTVGTSGLLFPPGDAHELARQVLRALDDPLLRTQVTHFNRRRLEGLTPFEEGVRELIHTFAYANA